MQIPDYPMYGNPMKSDFEVSNIMNRSRRGRYEHGVPALPSHSRQSSASSSRQRGPPMLNDIKKFLESRDRSPTVRQANQDIRKLMDENNSNRQWAGNQNRNVQFHKNNQHMTITAKNFWASNNNNQMSTSSSTMPRLQLDNNAYNDRNNTIVPGSSSNNSNKNDLTKNNAQFDKKFFEDNNNKFSEVSTSEVKPLGKFKSLPGGGQLRKEEKVPKQRKNTAYFRRTNAS